MDNPHQELISSVRSTAGELGIDPSDLLTAISYETGGKLQPGTWGGKGGQYLGYIQFSPENQKRYGVTPDQSPAEQMKSVGAYLKDRGVRPGMGLLDTYSAINAGRPGLYNRSDANNGGAPGTVADKVAYQMFGHRQRANALLGIEPAANQGAVAPVPAQVSPVAAAPTVAQGDAAPAALDSAPGAAVPSDDPSMAALAAMPQALAKEQPVTPTLQQINYPIPRGLARAQALARAMASQKVT